MQRVAITGAGGSGKTVLANRLSLLLDLPVTHLDALRYTSTWQLVPDDEFVAAQQAVTATGRWIIDGNSLASMPVRFAAADTIVFLDLPACLCLWGVLRRRWRYRGGQHPDGVHDRITWSFLTYITLFRRRTRPAVGDPVLSRSGIPTPSTYGKEQPDGEHRVEILAPRLGCA